MLMSGLISIDVDDQGAWQGIYRTVHDNGHPLEKGYFVNDELHGELKVWSTDGELEDHAFYAYGFDVTIEVNEIVDDVFNITDEEKMILKLKYGFSEYVDRI